MNKRSLRKNIIISIILLLIVIFSLSYLILTSTIKKSIINNVGELRYSEAKLVANNIERFISNNQHMLRVLAEQLENIDNDRFALQSFLNNYTLLLNRFDNGIFIFNIKGELMAEIPFVDPKRIGSSFSYREYFQQTITSKKPLISKPYISSKTGQFSIMFTMPVFEKNNIKFIIGGSINIQSSNNPIGALQFHKIGNKGYYYIYTKNRDFIFHPDTSRITKQDVPIGVNKLFDAAIKGFEGYGETINSKGLKFLATFVQIRKVDWILGGNYPIEEALTPYNKLKSDIAMFFLLFFALSIVGSLWMVRYFYNLVETLGQKISNINIEYKGIEPIKIDEKLLYKEMEPVVSKINALLEKINVFQNRMVELAKNEAINLIAGGLFHDISNHIMAANTRVYLLKKIYGKDPNGEKFLNELDEILQHITGLSKKLLSLSTTKHGSKKLINISDLLVGISKICKIEDKAENIILKSDQDLWLVYGDEIALSQVFQNLLINAIQAQKNSEKPIELSITNFDNSQEILTTLPKKRFVKVSIKDYGEGIDSDNFDKIFEPYFTTKKNGYGIGLTVAKKIILEHEGYIFVNSVKGEWTEFTVYLPYYAEKTLQEAKALKS